MAVPAATVIRPDHVETIDRGGGVRTVPLVTRGAGASQFLNGTTEFAAGAALPLHSHNCEESVLVLAGLAVFECDGERVEMDPGDITWVPPGAVHRFLNRGSEPMRILWIYGRVDATRTMAATGESFPIGTEPRSTRP